MMLEEEDIRSQIIEAAIEWAREAKLEEIAQMQQRSSFIHRNAAANLLQHILRLTDMLDDLSQPDPDPDRSSHMFGIVDLTAPTEFVTKSGKVLTQGDIEALVAEAERGYDVSQLQPRQKEEEK